jgi:hypothetical protein
MFNELTLLYWIEMLSAGETRSKNDVLAPQKGSYFAPEGCAI